MGQNRLKLMCNPYNKKISIKFTDKEGDNFWSDLSDSSGLNKFTQGEKSIQNCGKELIDIAQKNYNTGTAGLGIIFCGTKADYSDFKSVVNRDAQKTDKKISLHFNPVPLIPESDEAIRVIDASYEKIKAEFQDFMKGSIEYSYLSNEEKKIGEAIEKYNDITKSELNICVIGTYSSGKSTFINALIGAELLPKDAHPTTAKATKIHNGNKYEIRLIYSGEEVIIIWENGNYRYLYDESKTDESIKSLMDIIDSNTTDKSQVTEQMNATISVFNKSPEENPGISYILNKISSEINIVYPFRETYLDSSETQFTILDTPGSNSTTFLESHQKVLADTLKEQTNSLPVFVVQNDQLDTTDNAELKKALDKYKTTFDGANMLVIINKADEIELPDLKAGIKKEVAIKWESKKIIYVASIIALGSKKKDEEWAYDGYRQKFNTYKPTFLCQTEYPTELYRYSYIPDDDKKDIQDAAKEAKDDYDILYHNSGLYSVEYEISKYANKYLMYLKARERNHNLVNALILAEEALSVKKGILKSEEDKHALDKVKVKKDLEEKINNSKIDYKKFGDLIEDVEKEFVNRREAFIATLGPETSKQWKENKKKKEFSRHEKTELCHSEMIKQCDDFYKKIFPEIKKSMEDKLIKIASLYEDSIIQIVQSDEKLSTESKDSVLGAKIAKPKFTGSYAEFKSKGAFSGFLGYQWINPKTYSNKLIDDFGAKFRNDCIAVPYSKFESNLELWEGNTKEEYIKCLEVKNITLKDHNMRISKFQSDIVKLAKRIENLSEVKCDLKDFLVFKEDKYGESTI